MGPTTDVVHGRVRGLLLLRQVETLLGVQNPTKCLSVQDLRLLLTGSVMPY